MFFKSLFTILLCRSSRGLRGWSKLKKDDLISFIADNEEYPTDRATEDVRKMGKKTIKEFKTLAQIHDVKIRSKANKNEIIYLLGENHGERRRAYFERKIGSWELEIKANEEQTQWNQEIQDEEQSRQPSEPPKPKLMKGAINRKVQKWFIDGSEYKDTDSFLSHIEPNVRKIVGDFKGPKKVYMNLTCLLLKKNPRDNTEELDRFGSRSGTYVVTTEFHYDMMTERMKENLSKFRRNGSGWRLKSIIGLDANLIQFDPLDGKGHSKLPPCVTKKKAVINMENKPCKKECGECTLCDESKMCFKWAITRSLNPTDRNSERVTKDLREQAKSINWDDISFPTKVNEISI